MVKFLVIVSVLFLVGCQTTRTVVDNSRIVVVSPPASLFNCPQAGRPPNPDTLTNRQVAEYVAKLYRYNKICKLNMDKIRQYVLQAEQYLEEKQSDETNNSWFKND